MRAGTMAALLLAVGCSPMTTTTDAGAGGGTTSGGGSAAGGSAAGGSAAGGSAAGGSAAGGSAAGGSAAGGSAAGGSAGPTRIGTVSITQDAISAAGQTFYSGLLLASFFEIPAQYQGCTTTTIGACTVSDCAAAADGGTPPDGGQVGAGTLTFTGLVDGGVTLAPNAMGSYVTSIQAQLFTAGSTLQVSSTGGAVPAFNGSVMAPEALVLTTPACPSNDCGMISKAAGLPLAWTGGSSGSFGVQLLSGSGQISCSFPAAGGAGSVPAAALASLSLGAGTLIVGGSNSTTVQAGAFPVVLSASQMTAYQLTLAP